MAVEPSEDRLTFDEFQAEARHKGVPAVSLSPLRFMLAAIMLLVGVVAILAGVWLIYWKATPIVAGALLLYAVFQVNLVKDRDDGR